MFGTIMKTLTFLLLDLPPLLVLKFDFVAYKNDNYGGVGWLGREGGVEVDIFFFSKKPSLVYMFSFFLGNTNL